MIFEVLEFDNHRSIHVFHDADSGLRAVIALHRIATRAAGGVRMMQYNNSQEAVSDALRLSRAMTYKWALAGLPHLGGGKSVILGDPRSCKTPDLLHAFGRAVNSLGGLYGCGADVGTNAEDMAEIAKETRFVRGLPGQGGDTSPPTAVGVTWAMRAAIEYQLGVKSFQGLRVAVQGVGGVGAALVRLLHSEGARLMIADIDAEAASQLAQETGAEICDTDDFLRVDVDILAPCALGGLLTERSVEEIRAKIICGGANNQLAQIAVADSLSEMGILCIPDYVANAGGILASQMHGPDYDEEVAVDATKAIYQTTTEVLDIACRLNVTPYCAAENLGRRRIAEYDSRGM